MLLSEASPGSSYTVSGMYERDRRLLEFLEERAVRPGAKVRVVDRNYDETMTLMTDKGKISLGSAAAERVWVAPEAGKRAGQSHR